MTSDIIIKTYEPTNMYEPIDFNRFLQHLKTIEKIKDNTLTKIFQFDSDITNFLLRKNLIENPLISSKTASDLQLNSRDNKKKPNFFSEDDLNWP